MGNTNIRVNTSLFELELKPKFEIKVNRKRERESESENETINNSKKFKPLVSEKKASKQNFKSKITILILRFVMLVKLVKFCNCVSLI